MNFQFTSKIKNVIYAIIGVGVVLMVLGFLTEKSHLYVSPQTTKNIALLEKHKANKDSFTHEEKLYWNQNKVELEKGVDILVADALLVEYYHETPFTEDELKANIVEAGKKEHIAVTFHEFGKDNHHHEKHNDAHGDANVADAHHKEHKIVFLATATEIKDGKKDNGHGHGAHHTPLEKLEHIIHHEGAFTDTHHSRSWSNLLVNGFFFFGIGLGALFFIALQYATESGWGVVTKRLMEAITAYLPVGAIFLLIVFIGASLGLNHIYHWMDPRVSDPLDSHFDHIIANKSPFLSQSFFWIATIIYIAVFLIGARVFRKRSLQEDIEGGTKIHFKNYVFGAIFLVLFGYLSSSMAWHWIMSIDTHWFSTLFGWYVFSGIWISGIITILLLIFFLKGQGYLKFINESHIHDLGKWMFAVSILWSYLLFSQYMLIWYANIPEEVTYYLDRFKNYNALYWTMFAINLILPLVFLMSREAKRSKTTIVIIGCILFVTHWIDVFIMVMPGTVFDHWEIGALEIGMFLTFLGIFIYVVLNALTKAPLLVKSHPYLEENLHQHT